MLAEGAVELEGAIEQLDRQIADAAAAALAPNAGDPSLEVFRQKMRGELASVSADGLPLDLFSPNWDAAENVGAVWVAAHSWAGVEAWLRPEHQATASLWIDRWVHSVTITEKHPAVRLNV
jgi:hypothetical protein